MDFILELLQKPRKKDIPKILIIRKLQRNFFFFLPFLCQELWKTIYTFLKSQYHLGLAGICV